MKTLSQRIIFLLLIAAQAVAQLPRSTPEAEGVSSAQIQKFIEVASESKHEFHSFMILRHGKVISEGWWNPYAQDIKHTMYSVSKSFAATAVGFAVMDGKLSVDDKVISFFPDKVPSTVSENLAKLRVRDLLSMSVGQGPGDPTGPVVTSTDWVKTFLATPIVHEPGTKFLYNSAATFMCSAIVQKVTGRTTLDYLQEKLFKPLNISNIDWETDPSGASVGGWGLRLKTEDMAKFGQLFLQKGSWNGKQILASAWVDEASSTKIMQDPTASQSKKDSSDWLQGYCYQMWRSRHNSYRGDGANGQYILVFPEHDAVVAITAEAPDMQTQLNIVWEHLLPAFQDKKLKKNPAALLSLQQTNSGLAVKAPATKIRSSLENQLSGRRLVLTGTDDKLRSFGFDFSKDQLQLSLETDSTTHELTFGHNQWASGETTKYGPYLVARAVNNRVGLPAFKTFGRYRWEDAETLELTLKYIESPHTETIKFKITKEGVEGNFDHIFIKNYPSKNDKFKGRLE